MSPRDSDWPTYYYDDAFADSLDESQRRYIHSKKGKAALRRYFQSDKGKEAFRRDYQRRKRELELVRAYLAWLKTNPNRTVEDFLSEQNSNSHG